MMFMFSSAHSRVPVFFFAICFPLQFDFVHARSQILPFRAVLGSDLGVEFVVNC